MLGDLMERTSLADALDKLQSDVASQSFAGLDALKGWLEDQGNLEKADGDPEVWPAVLKVLEKYGKRQLQALFKAGGRKGTFKADGPAVLQQVLQHMGRRRLRKTAPTAPLVKAQQRIWMHIEEVLRSEIVGAKQPESLFYFCKAAAALSEAAEHGALLELRGSAVKRLWKPLLEVSGSSRTQGIALDAAANLCRHLDGDIVGDLPFICERSLALLQSCGQAAANCLAAAALRAPFAFRDWLTRHLEMLLGKVTASWPTQPQNIDQLELVLRLALNLGVTLPKREAQTLLPLVTETLDLHARANASVEQSRWRGAKDRSTLLRTRLADLMAALLWQSHGSATDATNEICTQLDRRCLPWALCLVRFAEREHCLSDPLLVQLLAAVLRQLSKARVEMELPALHTALAALLNTHGWARLGQRISLPVWCSLLCPEMQCSLASPGIVELLPALDRHQCTPELLAQFTAVVEYVKAASSNKQLSSSFWPVLSMLFLLLPVNDVKELQENFFSQISTKSPSPMRACIPAAARRQQLGFDLQRHLLEVLLLETFDYQAAFLRISSTSHLPDPPEPQEAVSAEWTLEMNDFYLAVPLKEVPQQPASELIRQRCSWLHFDTVLQRRLAMAALCETTESRSAQGSGAAGLGAEIDEVLLHRFGSAAALQVDDDALSVDSGHLFSTRLASLHWCPAPGKAASHPWECNRPQLCPKSFVVIVVTMHRPAFMLPPALAK
ncbi:unnamed protein product [Durusdinium trenchii]|uniref:Uncharacterized protein n=1 Tax=Durusdinium trenchii TaxID=1381693 RepID=A0ABP0QWI9_9DINO